MTVAPLDLVGQALALDPDGFAALERSAAPLRLALGVVFLAGVSTALGQSVVLFAARITPRRFAASLILQAVIFVAVYLLWTLSIWLVARAGFGAVEPYRVALAAVGLAYAPQLFGFFVLVPFLGAFIGAALSIWNLLAIALATSVVFELDLAPSLACSAGGWLLLQIVQRTIGWPVARVTQRLRQAVAGQPLGRLEDLLRGRELPHRASRDPQDEGSDARTDAAPPDDERTDAASTVAASNDTASDGGSDTAGQHHETRDRR